jgi:C4-dicarboxylate-specific signal transduction histidine kinase
MYGPKKILRIAVLFTIFLLTSSVTLYYGSAIIFRVPVNLMTYLLLISGLLLSISLWILYVKEHFHQLSLIIISFYSLSSIYCLARWGIDLGQGLILIALTIIMSGTLLGRKVMAGVTLILIYLLLIISLAHSYGILKVDRTWRTQSVGVETAIGYSLVYIALASLAWLYSHEMHHLLVRALCAETNLRKERDTLEKTVHDRTQSLLAAQYERTLQLHKLADFGRNAASLFHDLANPLTTQLLYLEKLSTQVSEYDTELTYGYRDTINRIADTAKKMEICIRNARQQYRKEDIAEWFAIRQEIESAIESLNYKKNSQPYTIIISPTENVEIWGNPVSFYKLLLNLLSNAIDACKDSHRPKNIIRISCLRKDSQIYLEIKDSGCGIPQNIMKKIYDPFFTTKGPSEGSGIGLSICKQIVEKEFNGTISISSKLNSGTKVEIILRSPSRLIKSTAPSGTVPNLVPPLTGRGRRYTS